MRLRPPAANAASLKLGAAVLAMWALGSSTVFAQQAQFDIGGGDPPTITGALNGTVLVNNPSPLFLDVTVNFGEVSPMNRSAAVVVRVPVIIRSSAPYQVTASVTATNTSIDADGLRLTDVGFGITSLRRLSRGQVCQAPHTVYPPYNNDPSQTVNRAARAAYPSSLGTLGPNTVLLSGPELSSRLNLRPPILPSALVENGYAFDVVLAVVPQFFTPSSTSLTLRLTIDDGPALACQ